MIIQVVGAVYFDDKLVTSSGTIQVEINQFPTPGVNLLVHKNDEKKTRELLKICRSR